MARTRTKKAKPEPVYTWAFQSSQPRGGVVVQYIAQLNADETLSCNCPGWIFSKGDKDKKTCRHIRDESLQTELPDVIRKWKAGEEMDVLVQGDAGSGFVARGQKAAMNAKLGDSKIRFGRVIEI